MGMETDFGGAALAAAPAVAPAAARPPGTAPSGTAPARGGTSFGDVLSMLNPLQYVPVVGMIYRAVTGDTIPEPVRVAGGLIFSVLTGGPVGVVISAATEVAEHALGVDPEKIGHSMLASIGLAGPAAPTPGAAPVREAGKPGAPPQSPQQAVAAAQPASPKPAPAAAEAAPTMTVAAADPARRNIAYAWAAAWTAPDPVIGAGG